MSTSPLHCLIIVDFNVSVMMLCKEAIMRAENFLFFNCTRTQVSYRFLALGCFPANLVSDVVCVLRVGSLKG